MNLMAVSLAAVIVVLIAVKIKELDSGYGIVLSIAGCVMLMYFVVSRFRLIASYIDRLTAYVSVNISYIDVILKMIGIAYICRFSSDICKDAGCNAMASQVEMAGKITLILLSMPILMGVIDLVVTIVEGNLIVVVLMLFMGVSVPDAANVCNESKVESYDTDIKYCPEFYAENEKENTTESDSDINSDILEDDSVIGSLNEITKDKSDVTFYDIYESLKSGDVDSTIDMALKVFSDSVIYEVRTSRGLALQIIAVIVLGSTFAQLAGNMGEYVSAHGFMVTYMVLLSLLLGISS